MSALHVDSVRKMIGGKTILNDIFLSCQPGEIVGLLGRNGCGKSSLLKIIFGSSTADNKFVTVDLQKTGNLFSVRHLINYLPQHNYLPNHIKLKHIINCFCAHNAAELMKHEFIKPFLDKKATQLSGGERRLAEILIIVHSEAKILLLDEPFHGIAPMHKEGIKDIIRFHSKNKAIIITDHDYENVIDISSRIVMMQDGNTRPIKTLDELAAYGYLPATTDLNAMELKFSINSRK